MSNYEYPSKKCCGTEQSSPHEPRCTEQFGFIEGFGSYKNVSFFHSCDKCGASVIEIDTHLAWHEANDRVVEPNRISEVAAHFGTDFSPEVLDKMDKIYDIFKANEVDGYEFNNQSKDWSCNKCAAKTVDTEAHTDFHHKLGASVDESSSFYIN